MCDYSLMSLPNRCVAAVCIPPGTRLLVRDIPEELQTELRVGQTEHATFTQITADPYSYRDAIRFRNGREVILQKLREGQRVRVLDMGIAEKHDPVMELLSRAG